MKTVLITLAFVLLSPMAVFANPLSSEDLVGNYLITGNRGFLVFDVNFNDDRTANFEQKTMDGTVISCRGVYSFDESTQDFISVYNCEAGDVVTHRMNFAGVTSEDLVNGVTLDVTFESSLGAEPSTVAVEIIKTN